MATLTFSEPEIQKLFGHEAAEDEDPARLREYYFKTSTYEQLANELPLRILVGHKGIGKSALFAVAMAEDKEAKRVVVLIKPDDIAGMGTDTTDFLSTIRSWREGLSEIIGGKVLHSFGRQHDGVGSKALRAGSAIINTLKELLTDKAKLNLDPMRDALYDSIFQVEYSKRIY